MKSKCCGAEIEKDSFFTCSECKNIHGFCGRCKIYCEVVEEPKCNCLLPNGLLKSSCFNGCSCPCHKPTPDWEKEVEKLGHFPRINQVKNLFRSLLAEREARHKERIKNLVKYIEKRNIHKDGIHIDEILNLLNNLNP